MRIHTDMLGATEALFDEMRLVIADALDHHPQRALFAGLDTKLAAGTPREVEPLTQPVVGRWLDEAVHAAPDPWQRLAALLLAATPALPWVRSYENLETSPELEAFRSFYSYQVLAGPIFRGHEPPVLVDGLLVGFSLQAPNVFYPQHHHAPPEIYGVISGGLEWQVGDTWSNVGPGDVIVHRPHESHAMRTSSEPALTWVAWPSEPNTNVYMPSLDPPDKTMAPRYYPRDR